MTNPFLAGPVVSAERFINRRSEVRRAVSLIGSGQSVALVGPPRSGKTSMLHYLMDSAMQNHLFGQLPEKLAFIYMDAQTFAENASRANFWDQIINFLSAHLSPTSQLQDTCRLCRQNDFGTSILEKLFEQLKIERLHLILLLDEFDTVLEHPQLNQTEFYAGLRSLASRFGRAFTLVTASRQSVTLMNEKTQEFARTGSPFFNFMGEIPLLPFEEKAARQILLQAEDRFGRKEVQALLDLTGGHPYLLQSAGSALWECHEDKLSPVERRTRTGHALLHAVSDTLNLIWKSWDPATRRVFALVALDEMPTLITQRNFDLDALRDSFLSYPREITALERQGFVIRDDKLPFGWRVSAEVMLWWMAEELINELRRNDELGQFLTQNEWDGMFTKGEKNQFLFAITEVSNLAKTGAEVFIKAAAEGLGKGISALK